MKVSLLGDADDELKKGLGFRILDLSAQSAYLPQLDPKPL